MPEEALTAVLVLPERASNPSALVECLRGSRFRVLEANGEREAVRLAATCPDLILLATETDDGRAEALEARLRVAAANSAIARVPLSSGDDASAVAVLAATLRSVLDERRRSDRTLRDRAVEAGLVSLERDIRVVERLSGSEARPSLASAPQSFRVTRPASFAEAVRDYAILLDQGLEQAGYRVEHDVSGGLRALAAQLATASCGPRDVIEIHAMALKRKTYGIAPARARAYTDEARLLVLELMGHLVAIYRQRLMPSLDDNNSAPTSPEDTRR